jgi:hypothetical protein
MALFQDELASVSSRDYDFGSVFVCVCFVFAADVCVVRPQIQWHRPFECVRSPVHDVELDGLVW